MLIRRPQVRRVTDRLDRVLPWVRLAWGVASTAAGLLTVLPAPNDLFWKVGLAMSELGHFLAVPALLPLWPGWWRTRAGQAGASLGAVGAALALSTVVRADSFARQVPDQVAAAFGTLHQRAARAIAAPPAPADAPARSAPLVLLDLLRGVGAPPVERKRAVYAEPAGTQQILDLYLPPNPGPAAPLVITIHGGSWQRGDKADQSDLNRYLAARGYAVAALNYRLAPQWRFPAAVEDVHAAIAYLKARADAFHLDAHRIVLLGRSAGGQLALLAAYTPLDRDIRGVVSIYGPTDLVYGYTHPTNPAVLDSPATLTDYLGGSPARVPDAYAAASPINFVRRTTPPTLLIHGDRDALVFVAHSARLAARLAEEGVPHLLLRLPWADHGCDFVINGPSGQIALYTIERYLAAVFSS